MILVCRSPRAAGGHVAHRMIAFVFAFHDLVSNITNTYTFQDRIFLSKSFLFINDLNITRATRQILRIKINDEKNRVYSNITIYIIVRTCRYPWKGTRYTKELKHLSNTSNSAAFAVIKRLKTFVENKESKSLMLPVKLS